MQGFDIPSRSRLAVHEGSFLANRLLAMLVSCTRAVRRGLLRRDAMFAIVLGCLVLWSGIEVDGLNQVQTIKRAYCRVQTGIVCPARTVENFESKSSLLLWRVTSWSRF